MPKLTIKERQAQKLMRSLLTDGVCDNTLQLDSVTGLGDQLHTFSKEAGNATVHQAVLDGINDYKKLHGVEPEAAVVAVALDHAQIMLDEAVAGANSLNSNSRALVPQNVQVAIRAMIGGAVPFAHYASADKNTGEASVILVSHNAGKNIGGYGVNASLDGVGGGEVYIHTDRSHRLSSEDNTTFTGKITPVMTGIEECDQSATAHPLYPARTQILVNGLRIATTQKGTNSETAAGAVRLGDKDYGFTAKVDITTGEVTVTFDEAVPENTAVTARGFLNLESQEPKYDAPSVIIDAQKYSMFAKSYRSHVVVTPEAKVQFETEIGIDPAFEGTMAIRQQFAQETLYSCLNSLSVIGQYQNPNVFNFDWQSQGVEKTQSQIAVELVGQISKISQTMANQNGSHGVSHIYVGETMRAVFLSMPREYFEPSGLEARPGSYRLGRLAGLYEVYYTPKGIIKNKAKDIDGKLIADRMLLIGASSANPAFNPVILGEVSAPKFTPIAATEDSPNQGYWVTGKAFKEQNPINMYASSVAVVDVLNTAY